MIKSQQVSSHGSVVARIKGSSQRVEYLCKMINTHEHCHVESSLSLSGKYFNIKCLRHNNLCKSVLLSLKNTQIMNELEILKEV